MARYINTPKTSLKGINAELVKVQDAFEDVLDRRGDGANFLDTDLDMNSQRILNLPEPVYSQEPVRLGDVKAFIDDTKTALDAAIEAAENALASEEAASDEADRAEAAADVGASYLRSVQSTEDLKSLKVDSSLVGMRIRIKEYHAGTGYGGGEWEVVTGEAANDIDIIQSSYDASIQFKIISVSKLDLSQLGVRYGGVEYERSAIREFLTKGNVKNYVISGELLLKQGLGQPSGTRVEFEKGGKVRITSPFYAVWAFEGGDELTELVDPVIDGDNFLGCNGIGVGGSGLGTVTNIKITRPVLLRCKRQPDHTDIYNGGGRGIMVESNVTDVQIDNPQAIDCTSAYAYQCTTASPSDRVTVINPIAKTCMHYAEFFDLADFSNDPDSGEMGGINILGGYAYNCGKGEVEYYSGDGVFDATQDTGVIIGERARHVTWRGFKIHNENSYGKVGSAWRGTGFHIDIEGTFIGSAVAAYDGTIDNTLLPIGGGNTPPSGASINSRGVSPKIRVIGSVDYAYRCLTPSGITLGHKGHKVQIEMSSNPSVGLIDVPTARSDAYAVFYNYNTGDSISGAFNQIVNSGNQLSSDGSDYEYKDNLTVNGLLRVTATSDFDGILRSNGEFISASNATFDGSKTVRVENLPSTTGIQNRLIKAQTLPAGFSYVLVKD